MVWKVAGNFSDICCSPNVLLWLNVQKPCDKDRFPNKKYFHNKKKFKTFLKENSSK